MMRTSNPALNDEVFQIRDASATSTMTLQGTVVKTTILLAILMVGAGYTWHLAMTAAAAGAATNMPADFRVSITNAPGKATYPISSFTWLLIPDKIDDATKKKNITDFLHWMLTEGQNMVEALDYARLPKPVVAKEQDAISKIH